MVVKILQDASLIKGCISFLLTCSVVVVSSDRGFVLRESEQQLAWASPPFAYKQLYTGLSNRHQRKTSNV